MLPSIWLLLTALVYICAQDVAWDYYKIAFGEAKLITTFGSQKVFEQSIVRLEEPKGKFVFSCYAYKDGQLLAKEHRASGQLGMFNYSVFYSDMTADTMCFTFDFPLDEDEDDSFGWSESLNSSLMTAKFFHQFPTPLKVSEAIYEVLDQKSISLQSVSALGVSDLNDLINKFRYKPESSKKVNLGGDVDLAADFRRIRSSLDPVDIIEKFLSRLAKYNVTGLQKAFDFLPARNWAMNQFADTIMALANNFQHVDPCNFAEATAKLDSNRFILSMPELSSFLDFGPMCLGYTVSSLLQDPDLSHLYFMERPDILNFRSRSIQQSGSIGSSFGFAPYTDMGLTGLNQIVGISDTGLDEYSCYFYDSTGLVTRSMYNYPVFNLSKRKVVQYSRLAETDTSDVPSGHGTHVCGTVAGFNPTSANQGSTFNGVAGGAKIAFMDLAYGSSGLYVPGVNELYPNNGKSGARVHTNSWGSPFTSTQFYYGSDIDLFLYRNPDYVIFFAAGNFGGGTNRMRTLSMQASSKNTVAVGSGESTLYSTSISNVAYYSSEGPTYDNRIKPDIVAPGASIMSAMSNGNNGPSCGTLAKSGTSMASPSAAGIAALVRQYFMDANFWARTCNRLYANCRTFTPSGVLIKAVMLHSGGRMVKKSWTYGAIALGAPPDYIQGYGRVQLSNVLPLLNKYTFDLFVADRTSMGEYSQRVFSVTITDSSKPLKITLAWYDPPGSSTSSKALVHDLSIQVVSPSNAIFYGNNLKAYDNVNVNEQVFISTPTAGTWKVSVVSFALPYSGSQMFSLVITCGGRTTPL